MARSIEESYKRGTEIKCEIENESDTIRNSMVNTLTEKAITEYKRYLRKNGLKMEKGVKEEIRRIVTEGIKVTISANVNVKFEEVGKVI